MKQLYLDYAIKVLQQGGIVAYPTDTAYGLAADATNDSAVKKLYKLKGRAFKKPIHVIAEVKDLKKIVEVNAVANKLIKKFWPGPLTIVLPLKAKGRSWQLLSAKTGTMGIRWPNNKLALSLVKNFGKPITTTSANIAGLGDCFSVAEVQSQFRKSKLKPDFYLDGGNLKHGKPSTVVLTTKNHVKMLRQGPITEKQIKNVFGKKNKLLFSRT